MTTETRPRNAETILATYDAVNRRDIDAVFRDVSDDYRFVDHAQRSSGDGKRASREWMELMLAGSSDLRCSATVVAETGDVVVVKVETEGTHDGEWAGFAPTGRRVSLCQCEVYRFDEQGRIVEGELFYDVYGMLADIGAVPPLGAVDPS